MKTDDDILKEVLDKNLFIFHNSSTSSIIQAIKKAISLTRQAERKRILELIDETIFSCCESEGFECHKMKDIKEALKKAVSNDSAKKVEKK